MGVYRVEKNKNYTVMNKTALRDKRLSWKAKGIIAYMLSLPDDWKFYIEELTTHSTDGEASFRSGLKELKKCGYVKRFPVREGSKIKSWETVIFEIPLDSDFQQVENLHVENEDVGFQDVKNRRLLSTESLQSIDSKPNTDKQSIDKDIIPYSEIIAYLNEKTQSNYRASSQKTKALIKARWEEGKKGEKEYTLDDFKTVINKKAAEWMNDEMCKYLRPETLFGTKFEAYLNQKTKQTGRGVIVGKDQDARKFAEENGIPF